MTRKGKLVPSEHVKKLSCYGTQTTRLTTDSQWKFGDCCLRLEPAEDAVATPSGHIYSREAIVSYLLTKTQEIQEQRRRYKQKRSVEEALQQTKQQEIKQSSKKQFLIKDQGGTRQDIATHSSSFQMNLKNQITTETIKEGRDVLKRTSFWLSDFQPTSKEANKRMENSTPTNIPQRPSSPMSGQPLRLKDLVSLDLKKNDEHKFVCALSQKILTTQPIILIKKTHQVMLKSLYEELVKPTMICPITGMKFKEKDVLELQKASTGFSASGNVEAKRYTPTLT